MGWRKFQQPAALRTETSTRRPQCHPLPWISTDRPSDNCCWLHFVRATSRSDLSFVGQEITATDIRSFIPLPLHTETASQTSVPNTSRVTHEQHNASNCSQCLHTPRVKILPSQCIPLGLVIRRSPV